MNYKIKHPGILIPGYKLCDIAYLNDCFIKILSSKWIPIASLHYQLLIFKTLPLVASVSKKAFELVEKVDNRWRFAKCVFSHVFDGHNFIVEINMAYVNPFFCTRCRPVCFSFYGVCRLNFSFLELQRVKCSFIIVNSGNDNYKKKLLSVLDKAKV